MMEGDPDYRPSRRVKGLLMAGVAFFALDWVVFANNFTEEAPPNSCLSPFTVSESYADPGASLWLQTQTGVGVDGIIARGQLSADSEAVYGVEASYASPDTGTAELEMNASKMVGTDETGKYALKLALSKDPKVYAVRVVAPAGSPLCKEKPDVAFDLKATPGEYFTADGDLPYPTIVNGTVNVLGSVVSLLP